MSMRVHGSCDTYLSIRLNLSGRNLSGNLSGSLVLLSFSAFLFAGGCASNLPLVADPPQHEHYPPEDVPWEEEYSRMRPRQEIFEGEDVGTLNGAGEGEDNRGFEGVLADILGFPFRGVGWVLRGVF